MIENLKYSALWQNKRNEWPVENNQAADWLEMQGLLDQQLPVAPGSGGPGGSTTRAGNGIIKLLVILAVSVPLAVLLYFLINNGPVKTKKHATNTRDSLPVTNNTLAKSLALKDAIIAYDDSINNVQQQIINASTVLNSLLNSKYKTATTTDSVAVIKRKLTIANSVLSRLVTNRNKIALQDKRGDGNTANAYNAVVAGGVSDKSQSINDEKENITGQAATAHNVNRTTGAKLMLNHRPHNAGNGGSITLRPGGNTQPGSALKPLNGGSIYNNPGNQNNYPATNPGNNSLGRDDIAGNSLIGGQRDNGADLVAVNGYHPDIDALGRVSTAGNNPFKDAFLPGGLLYKSRLLPTSGQSKITVNKPPKAQKEKKIKAPKNPGDTIAYFDWGLLAGLNTNGSFTGESQNSNIYGSLPVDLYAGLFGTYHFNSRFGVQAQTWLLNPLKFNGGYSHANGSKVEKNAVIQISDSRKVYSITIPINFMYRVSGGLNIKAGPVISLPVKQVNGVTSLTPTAISRDTVYYRTVTGQLNATKYDAKPNIGFSGGMQLQTGRLIFDATFQKSLRGYNIVSEYGTYTNNPGVLQFTIGFKLNGSQ